MLDLIGKVAGAGSGEPQDAWLLARSRGVALSPSFCRAHPCCRFATTETTISDMYNLRGFVCATQLACLDLTCLACRCECPAISKRAHLRRPGESIYDISFHFLRLKDLDIQDYASS